MNTNENLKNGYAIEMKCKPFYWWQTGGTFNFKENTQFKNILCSKMSKSTLQKRHVAWSKHVDLNISQIRFTQVSISSSFSNGIPIKWTLYKLLTKDIKPCELPLIRVCKVNKVYKTLDKLFSTFQLQLSKH